MSKFKDSKGTEWLIALTIGDTFRIEDETESLGKVSLLDPAQKLKGEGLPLAVRLQGDERLFVAVLFALLQEQSKKAEITPEEFAGRLDGAAYADALDGFFEAWIDFFQKRRAPAQVKVIEAARTVITSATSTVLARVAKIDIAAETERIVGDHFDALSGNSPESAGSTPGPLPSGSSSG